MSKPSPLKQVNSGLVSALVVLGSLSGCAQLTVQKDNSIILGSMRIPAAAEWSAGVSRAGNAYLAYYDEKKVINLYDEKIDKVRRAEEKTMVDRVSSGVAVLGVGDDAYFAFRGKMPERDLYLSSFAEGNAAVGLGSDTMALPNMKLHSNGGDIVNAIWVGEAVQKDGKNNHIYYRQFSIANGKASGEAVPLFPGIYPVMAEMNDGKYLAFSWINDGRVKGRIVARAIKGNGELEEVQEIAKVGEITPIFGAVTAGEDVVAYWHHNDNADVASYKFEGVYYKKNGAKQAFVIPGLDGYDMSAASVAADGLGNIAVVVSAIRPDQKSSSKYNLLMFKSHDGGKTWSDGYALRRDSVLLEKNYAYAKAPKAKFLDNGKLLVAWQDWRYLRSAIFYSYSEDAGRTWQVEDSWLMGGGRDNVGLDADRESVFQEGDKHIRIFVEEFNGDALDSKRINIVKYSLEGLKKYKANPSVSKPTIDLLEARAKAYWGAMVDKDAERLYTMIDPYFRARVPLKAYKESLSQIEYDSVETKLVQGLGPVGLVVTKMNVEMKPTQIGGREVKIDKKEVEVPTRWMWIDDNWYLEYILESKNWRYAPY